MHGRRKVGRSAGALRDVITVHLGDDIQNTRFFHDGRRLRHLACSLSRLAQFRNPERWCVERHRSERALHFLGLTVIVQMPSDYFTVECWTSMAMAMAGSTFFITGKQSDTVRAPFDSV